MPLVITVYECNECRKRFAEFTDAQSCESNHFVDKIMTGFNHKLDKIFKSSKKKPAKLKKG